MTYMQKIQGRIDYVEPVDPQNLKKLLDETKFRGYDLSRFDNGVQIEMYTYHYTTFHKHDFTCVRINGTVDGKFTIIEPDRWDSASPIQPTYKRVDGVWIEMKYSFKELWHIGVEE